MSADLAAWLKFVLACAVLGLAVLLTGSVMGQVRKPAERLLRR